MGSKSKERVEVGRAEAAQRIQALADELSQGSVRLGEASFQVPEQVALEIEADKDELEIEIKWGKRAAKGAQDEPALDPDTEEPRPMRP